MNVEVDDLYIDALFHVIDADTSYNASLGRPWLYTSKAIASTLHQCLKYTDRHGNKKTIRGMQILFMGKTSITLAPSFTNQQILEPPKFF